MITNCSLKEEKTKHLDTLFHDFYNSKVFSDIKAKEIVTYILQEQQIFIILK